MINQNEAVMIEKLEPRKSPHEIRKQIAQLFTEEIHGGVLTTNVFTHERRKEVYDLLDMAMRKDVPEKAALAIEKATNLIHDLNLIPPERYNRIVNEGRRLSRDPTADRIE